MRGRASADRSRSALQSAPAQTRERRPNQRAPNFAPNTNKLILCESREFVSTTIRVRPYREQPCRISSSFSRVAFAEIVLYLHADKRRRLYEILFDMVHL
ncbi:hypothetical protein EVAR_51032_1 [Eumeta japonica]|uniref:Uncharacterized protein n=1 Tax=Eumeta variegata TaxID=151549 RepID=A0A4C1Y5W8_EUMVA|nr:hypothetical protein EVAR_51032_1 [Eumeta japonica]